MSYTESSDSRELKLKGGLEEHCSYLVSFSEGVSQLLAMLESSDSKELKLLQLASLIFRSSH